jgi:nucleotide-binding universal stress UspA family protein
MPVIRRILAPTDLSENSLPAVRYAVELAETFNAELVLLHVVQDQVLVLPEAVMPTPVAAVDVSELLAAARTGLASIVADLKLDRLNPKTEVRIGIPADEITTAAKDLNADLLCISTHGRTGLAHFFLGSVAEKIVRYAPCPVLTVRPTK